MAGTVQATVYDLNSDALKRCWNSLAAGLEYRDVFINRQDPMVSILYAASEPKPLDKLNAREILASVPFSRVHDRETTTS